MTRFRSQIIKAQSRRRGNPETFRSQGGSSISTIARSSYSGTRAALRAHRSIVLRCIITRVRSHRVFSSLSSSSAPPPPLLLMQPPPRVALFSRDASRDARSSRVAFFGSVFSSFTSPLPPSLFLSLLSSSPLLGASVSSRTTKPVPPRLSPPLPRAALTFRRDNCSVPPFSCSLLFAPAEIRGPLTMRR